jgi:integrase
MFMPCLSRRPLGDTGVEVRLGHELLDDYLRFVAARCRPNSVLAAGYDLKVFFAVVGKDPVQITTTDVLDFIASQRLPVHGSNVVRFDDGEKGLSARTIARRLATLSGLYGYLSARELVPASPVPTGLSVRLPASRQRAGRATPLIRTPRTLPRVLDAADGARLLNALRTYRDRAMVLAMLLGGLRRCEVLGLRLSDFDLADRRVTITEGKGGHHRIVPVASGFFTALSNYLDEERVAATGATTSRVFVTLKGPRRGQPLSAAGLDEILRGARTRAGIEQVTCHMLRHTCLTRLQVRGIAFDASFGVVGDRDAVRDFGFGAAADPAWWCGRHAV